MSADTPRARAPDSSAGTERAATIPDAHPDPTPVRFVQHVGDAVLDWSVVEVDARAVPGAHGARCLIFSRPECIRRVWDYPADWRTMDAAGLAALSWRR